MTPAYFSARLAKAGPLVGVRLVFSGPVVGGETMDRSPRFQVLIDTEQDGRLVLQFADGGVPLEVDGRTLRECRAINEAEYQFLIARGAWAQEHAVEHPNASPREGVDFNAMQPIF
jgi:hypothetical protein